MLKSKKSLEKFISECVSTRYEYLLYPEELKTLNIKVPNTGYKDVKICTSRYRIRRATSFGDYPNFRIKLIK